MAIVQCGPLVGTIMEQLETTDESALLEFRILVALDPVVTWQLLIPMNPPQFLVIDLTVPTTLDVIPLLIMWAVLFPPALAAPLPVLAADPTTDRRRPIFPPVTAVIMPPSRRVPMAQFRLNRTAPCACRLYVEGPASRLSDLLGRPSLAGRLTLNPARHLQCRLLGQPLLVTTTLMPDEPRRTLVSA